MLRIRPLLALFANAWDKRNGAVKLTFMFLDQSSSVVSCTVWASYIEALFTNTCGMANWVALSNIVCTSLGDLKSHRKTHALRPISRICAATSSASLGELEWWMMTSAPSFPHARAKTRPSRRAAPVMSTAFPLRVVVEGIMDMVGRFPRWQINLIQCEDEVANVE